MRRERRTPAIDPTRRALPVTLGILALLPALAPAAGAPGPDPSLTVLYPTGTLSWDGGRRAIITRESGERTPDGEPAILVALQGPPAPEKSSADNESLVASDLPAPPATLASRPVASIDFWLKAIAPCEEPILFVVRPGYGQRIPLQPAGWRKIESAAFGPVPVTPAEIARLVWRVALPREGARFLLGPARARIDPAPPRWHPAVGGPFVVSGLPWLEENGGALIRMPRRARDVDPNVWEKAQWPAGGRVRFRTDSSQVRVRADHGGREFGWPMLSPMSMGGMELYEGPPERMTFRAITTPDAGGGAYEATLARDAPRSMRDCTIYLPQFAPLVSLEIGLDPDARFDAPAPFRAARPTVFYGTSFVHGSGASRPSMTFPAMIGRMLGIDVVNLGFASEKRWETATAGFMAEIEAACYVVGPILNDLDLMTERYPAFVGRLRERRPDTPILLMTRLHTVGTTEPYAVNALVAEVRDAMARAGDRRVRIFDSFRLYTDGAFHPTIEGVHPTDLGFTIISDALAPEIARAIGLAPP